MGLRIQQIEHLHSNAQLLIDFEPNLAINGHGVVRLDTVILDQGTLPEIAELHVAEKRADVVNRNRQLAYPHAQRRVEATGKVLVTLPSPPCCVR